MTAASAALAGRFGAEGEFGERFVQLGYSIAPAAMISLLLGLGGELFVLLPGDIGGALKAALLVMATAWGMLLGWRILAGMGVRGRRAIPAWIPGAAGGLAVTVAWWPAVVGL